MSTCKFEGRSDFYGIGIRIGFYLQWYGTLLAEILTRTRDPDDADELFSEVALLRFTRLIFIAATFLSLVIETISNRHSLQVVEVYITLLLAYGSYLMLVPMYILRMFTLCNPRWDPSRFPLIDPGPIFSFFSFILLVAITCFQLWFWFERVPELDQLPCRQYGFFFDQVRLNNKPFQAVHIVLFFLLLLACLMTVSISILQYIRRIELMRARRAGKSRRRLLRRLNVINAIVVLTVVIAAIEATISWNEIEGVNSLNSPAQWIPMLLGIGQIIRVLYKWAFIWEDDDDDEEIEETVVVEQTTTTRPAAPAAVYTRTV